MSNVVNDWQLDDVVCPACGSFNCRYTDPADDPVNAGWECFDCDQYPPRSTQRLGYGSDNPLDDDE